MFGWRARIGYLCPSVFEMIAYDFYRIVPPGVGMIGVTFFGLIFTPVFYVIARTLARS